jgi:L-alanine-DL-glutamate epimerase-like enolase superfamily enzyme
MEAKLFRLRLALRNPFRIAHGSYSFRDNIFLWLGEGSCVGMGEAPIVPYYGISADEVEADLRRGLTRRLLEKAMDAGSLEEALAGSSTESADFAHAVSRSAFQSAVLSLRAALGGGNAAGLLGISEDEASRPCPASSFTVAYDDDPEEMARIAASCGFRRLKVKAGIAGDIERVALIRERLPEAIIRVDANQGWLIEEAPAKIAALERLGVELIEEPTVGSPSELEGLASATSVPILLDESARDIGQVRRYAIEAPSVAGIVVKTAKNGGPAASLQLARAARESGMEVMVSCMVETSLGVGAALSLAPLCSWCDLDAPLLIAEDPFTGLCYEDEVPRLPPGGVAPNAGLAAYIAGIESFRPRD